MPRQLQTQHDIEELELQDRQVRSRLQLVEAELSLYDPSGTWAFFQTRLDDIVKRETNALQTCPLEEVETHRAQLKLVRHLSGIPDQLRETRAQLQEQLNG